MNNLKMLAANPLGWFILRDVPTKRDSFWSDGVNRRCSILAFLYLLVVVVTVLMYINRDHHSWLPAWNHTGQALVALVFAGLPPFFYWYLGSRFMEWVYQLNPNASGQLRFTNDEIKQHTDEFKYQVDAGKAFWVALLGVYVAVIVKF